ncbi:DUF4265 domain-containing protein [Chitinophaga rhizophila]|uniref:DUF4265 domain-containing protein n=1 Tax=Chitinophaga rhizophila TaxID=2866212 RepID=A0ABS7GHT3_9BACT|nr:DUF4265 domain-containing protein [Chitinophaga rhizophila]
MSEDFIAYSGNGTVRIAIADDAFRKNVSNQLIDLGCETEGLPAKNTLTVNIPKSVNYRSIKAFLKSPNRDQLDMEENQVYGSVLFYDSQEKILFNSNN